MPGDDAGEGPNRTELMLSSRCLRWWFAGLCLTGLGQGSLSFAAQPLEEVIVRDSKLSSEPSDEEDAAYDYDPWEPFNEKTFSFNYKLDRYVLKPVATVYDKNVLDVEKDLIHNVSDNVAMPKRFINSLLQGKFGGAGRELARFLINSTLGGAGMADVARYQFGILRSDEDTGQTFGKYGLKPGPYLVVPFMAPLTVRDGVGYIFDLAMDPLNYILPIVPSIAKKSEDLVNERALNLETFESVEEATLDLYSAVRNAYLKRREKQIKE